MVDAVMQGVQVLFSRQPHGCGVPRRTASFCFFEKISKPLEPALGAGSTGRWN
jgi:hypothetical protein